MNGTVMSGSRVEGVVSQIEDGMAVVDVAVQKGCGRCDEPGGCGGGLAVGGPACSRSYRLADDLGVHVGDEVVLTVPSGGILRAAGWAYGMPLILGLASAFIGAAIGEEEGFAIAGGAAGLVLGFILLRSLSRAHPAAANISMEFKSPKFR
jgi:sigma-E factor negative regulatory protein RseC